MTDGKSDSYHVVSLSGGKDSTAMLLMMAEREMSIDEVVWFDTGWEFPAMAEHIDKLERDTGLEITRLHPDKPFEYYMYDHELKRGKRAGESGYGWARPNARWCTRVKNDAIKKHIHKASGGRETIQYVGIAADEPNRIKDKVYPLVEWGVTEKMALSYCYERGYDWGGLYEMFGRVSCWCCPLKSLAELRTLRREFPELWEKLNDMDRKAFNTFRIDYSIEQLEQKFKTEGVDIRI